MIESGPEAILMCRPWESQLVPSVPSKCAHCPKIIAVSYPAAKFLSDRPWVKPVCVLCGSEHYAGSIVVHQESLVPPGRTSCAKKMEGMTVAHVMETAFGRNWKRNMGYE